MHSRLLPSFFSTSFTVTEFMLRLLIHLDLSFVQDDKYDLFVFFYMLTPSYANNVCWRCFLFVHFTILVSLSKIQCLHLCGLFEVFNSIPMIHLFVFMPIPSCCHYSARVELEDWDGDTVRHSFIVQDCFSYPRLIFDVPY